MMLKQNQNLIRKITKVASLFALSSSFNTFGDYTIVKETGNSFPAAAANMTPAQATAQINTMKNTNVYKALVGEQVNSKASGLFCNGANNDISQVLANLTALEVSVAGITDAAAKKEMEDFVASTNKIITEMSALKLTEKSAWYIFYFNPLASGVSPLKDGFMEKIKAFFQTYKVIEQNSELAVVKVTHVARVGLFTLLVAGISYGIYKKVSANSSDEEEVVAQKKS